MAKDSLRLLFTEICPPLGINLPKQSLETSKIDIYNASKCKNIVAQMKDVYKGSLPIDITRYRIH